MTQSTEPRKPRVFAPDDPSLAGSTKPDGDPFASSLPRGAAEQAPKVALPTAADVRHGIRWGAIFLSAMAALSSLAAGVAFARFVATALERQDWVGWTAAALLATALLAAAIMLLREVVGLFRLRRLARLRKSVDAAIRSGDRVEERAAVRDLKSLYGDRADMRWSLKTMAEHEGDVHDAGQLLRLADRVIIAPIDAEARRTVLASAKRVSVVTAMSPMVWVAMLYVVIENVRMMRGLAALYGGRPGAVGALRLARLVVGHIIATGGVAMTDDLLGQFLGQDVLRRLSRRLGEGVFNGALTARIGTAAIEVTRPLPFLDAPPLRARDIVREFLRRQDVPAAKPASQDS